WTGIKLGLAIRKYKFSTAVSDGVRCLSSCAIAWLGGVERYMGPKALIGFHGIRQPDNPIPSSNGNAIVGAYLSQIGITNFWTIDYLTKTHPLQMTMVKAGTFNYLGIPVKEFNLTDEKWIWVGMELGTRKHEQIQPSVGQDATRTTRK